MAGVGPGDAVDSIRNADLVARYPAAAGGQAVLTGAAQAPQLFPGVSSKPPAEANANYTGQSNEFQTGSQSQPGEKAGSDGIEVNFDNADIQTVAKSILSDTLGLNVLVDPRVQGSVTLVSSAPIPRKDLFAAFESVMRMSNAAVVREGNLVKILPLPEAAGAGGKVNLRGGEAGFGVTIVPLR